MLFPFKPFSYFIIFSLSPFLSLDLKRFMKMIFSVYISSSFAFFSLPPHKVVVVVVLLLLLHHNANAASECDLFTGRWELDKSYPLYDPAACPFIEREFTCQKNGRPDLDYTKYRWQPLGCNLLRYRTVVLYLVRVILFVSDHLLLTCH